MRRSSPSPEKNVPSDPRDMLPRYLGILTVKKQDTLRAVSAQEKAAVDVRGALRELKGQLIAVSGRARAVRWAGNPEPMLYSDPKAPAVPLGNYKVGEVDRVYGEKTLIRAYCVWLHPPDQDIATGYFTIIDELHIATSEEIAALLVDSEAMTQKST